MRARALLLILLLAALFGCSSGGDDTVRSDDGPTPNEDTEPDEEASEDETTTTDAPRTTAAPAQPSTSPFLAVSGNVVVPEGALGELSIVHIGVPDGDSGSVPVIVRNRTDDRLYDIGVSGTARDAAGALIGSGEDQGLAPSVVEPGEWAFGYVYIGTDNLPADATFDLTATGESEESFIASLDAVIVEHNLAQGDFGADIVGILRNDHDTEMTGPVSVLVGCFTADGTQMTNTFMTFADGDTIPAGGTTSFSAALFDDDCPIYVIGSSGYSS